MANQYTEAFIEQALVKVYYRGCWHVVSRCFFFRYRHPYPVIVGKISFRLKELYNPKAFFTHAVWLDQACAHCPKFPTAASRRSLDRVSVPVWYDIFMTDSDTKSTTIQPLPSLLKCKPLVIYPFWVVIQAPSINCFGYNDRNLQRNHIHALFLGNAATPRRNPSHRAQPPRRQRARVWLCAARR